MEDVMESTHHTEDLGDATRCFECGVRVTQSVNWGLAVTEGIVLCQACCIRRGSREGHEYRRLTMPPWFDDLAASWPHA
jgi:hypothetical protein